MLPGLMRAGSAGHAGPPTLDPAPALALSLTLSLALILALSLMGTGACRASGSEAPAPRGPVADRIPARPADAVTGSEFARRTTGRSGSERQRQAVAELERGNVPDFLRVLVPVRTTHATPGGKTLTATLWVSPDYLAIGSDADFLRIPLTYPSATRVAGRWGFALPTRRIVDAIYEQADHRLEPRPMKPGPRMRSSVYYLAHQRTVEEQRAGRRLGELVAGHKKDVVITNRLKSKKGRIAIYGWHQAKGRPIQPLSTVHDARYADYSHGLRLVHERVWVDGEPRSLYELLEDPALAPLVSYEGVIAGARALSRPPPPAR